MLDFTLTINGVDFTNYIKYDTYSTKKTPQYSRTVETIDGVTHVVKKRDVGAVSFELNPQNAENTAIIADALMTQPCEVYYFSLQTQQYETADMRLDDQSAEYLVRCKFLGLKWNQASAVTLTEL